MIKIFFDETKQGIVVTRAGQFFAPRSLTVTFAGSKITIWQPDNITKIVEGFPFTEVVGGDNQNFSTIQDCVSYLEEEFAKPVVDYATLVNEGLI